MELSLPKPRPLPRKPLLLKDYLLEDLSSCSSSGFRSYPRRQCCTTVRFLLEIDLKNKPPKYKKKPVLKNPSQPPSTSAIQRASEAMIKAVKHFPFASTKSASSSSKLKLSILSRSLSKKLLKCNFWKRTNHIEIQRRTPIEHVIEKKSSPLPPAPDFIVAGGVEFNSSTRESNSQSNSWSDSDFTASDDSLLCNSETNTNFNKTQNEDVAGTNLPTDVVNSKSNGAIVSALDDSMDATTSSSISSTNSTNTKQWPNEEEKQQFSPVSVLDCPFDDEDDEVSSPFQNRLARTEGTEKRLMKKIMRFERLTQLEPVNLEKRIALSKSDQESNESPFRDSSDSILEGFVLDMEEEENPVEKKSLVLLHLMKDTVPSSFSLKLSIDKLLLDFFKEGMENNSLGNTMGLNNGVTIDNELLHIAKDWLNGQPCELLSEWEVQKNREAYIQDIERGGKWRNLDEEKQELALQLEVEVFASLVNELLDDLLLS